MPKTKISFADVLPQTKISFADVLPKIFFYKQQKVLFNNDDKDVIAEYRGEIINAQQAQRRIELNHCRYLIYLNQDKYLNCEHTVRTGHCKASLANSPLHCWNYHTNSKAVANAAIRVYSENGIHKAVLKATTKISSGTEI